MYVVTRAVGAVVARFLDTEEVTGSNPVPPMMNSSTKDVEEFFIVLTGVALSHSVNYILPLESIKQPTPKGRRKRIIKFLLRQEIRNDVTMDICEAIVSPLIPVCQPMMVDSQLV